MCLADCPDQGLPYSYTIGVGNGVIHRQAKTPRVQALDNITWLKFPPPVSMVQRGLEVYEAFIFIPKGIKKKDMESNTSEFHHVS